MSDDRTRIWFASFVLVVFCFGLAAGILIGRRMGSGGPPFGRAGAFRGMPIAGGARPAALVNRLASELQLTDNQKARVAAIVDERRGRLEGLRKDVRGRFEREQQELRAEIQKVLTPEQQERFGRWLEREPRDRRRPGPGGPLRPPGDRF